jgi:hypothetical protein
MDVVQRRRLGHFAQGAQLIAAGEARDHRPKSGEKHEYDRRSTDGYRAPMKRKSPLQVAKSRLQLAKCLVYGPL